MVCGGGDGNGVSLSGNGEVGLGCFVKEVKVVRERWGKIG